MVSRDTRGTRPHWGGPVPRARPPTAAMRLLFITANRIGDAVLSTGVLDRLLTTHPGARVTVACGPLAAPLFEKVPGLDRLIALRKAPRAGHWRRLWRAAVGTHWDLVVDLRASLIAYALPTKRRLVFRPSDAPVHRVAQLAALIDAVPPPPPPRLWLDDADRAAADGLVPGDGRLLALAPAANWIGKTWPADRFAALAQRLTGPRGPLPGARIVLLGGPGDEGAGAAVKDAINPNRLVDLIGAVDPRTAGAVLRRADLFVGNDSGLAHVAAAAGAPTVALFGPSREDHYAPWGPRAAAVRTPESYAAIKARPDYHWSHDRAVSYMDTLAVETVERAAADLLTRLADSAA